jgi:phosphoserine phosphatase
MRRLLGRFLMVCHLVLASSAFAGDAEPHANPVAQELTALRNRNVAAVGSTNSIFVAFWDFDGTVLDGDCSEGLIRNSQSVYPGLAQKVIESGLSPLYGGTNGFTTFWQDYQGMDERIGHWLAYPFIAQMMRGARADDIAALATRHFQATLRRHYFASSLAIMRDLQANGIEIHIVSASPELFVRGAAQSLDIPPERIHGIRTVQRCGLVTEELAYPVTWADGKRERIQEILREIGLRTPGHTVYVIAGFGNSYGTDGPFLKWIEEQTLPSGHPISFMINGGPEPEPYRGLFRRMVQSAVIGD